MAACEPGEVEEELRGLDGRDRDLGRGDALDAAGAVGDAPVLDDAADGVVGDEVLVAERRVGDATGKVVRPVSSHA